jgi:hypothetical protein
MLLLSVGYPLLSIDKRSSTGLHLSLITCVKNGKSLREDVLLVISYFLMRRFPVHSDPFTRPITTPTHTLYCPLTISTPFRFLTSGKRAGPPFRPFFFLYATNLTKRERRNESNNTCLILGTQLRIRSFFYYY